MTEDRVLTGDNQSFGRKSVTVTTTNPMWTDLGL